MPELSLKEHLRRHAKAGRMRWMCLRFNHEYIKESRKLNREYERRKIKDELAWRKGAPEKERLSFFNWCQKTYKAFSRKWGIQVFNSPLPDVAKEYDDLPLGHKMALLPWAIDPNWMAFGKIAKNLYGVDDYRVYSCYEKLSKNKKLVDSSDVIPIKVNLNWPSSRIKREFSMFIDCMKEVRKKVGCKDEHKVRLDELKELMRIYELHAYKRMTYKAIFKKLYPKRVKSRQERNKKLPAEQRVLLVTPEEENVLSKKFHKARRFVTHEYRNIW